MGDINMKIIFEFLKYFAKTVWQVLLKDSKDRYLLLENYQKKKFVKY